MCDGELLDVAEKLPRAETIARLNDVLRKNGRGGRIVFTRGVCSLPGFNVESLLALLAVYDAFDGDNDPHGERDFGDLQFGSTDLLWKIDYYDVQLVFASPDPADARCTVRVLTLMLESEY